MKKIGALLIISLLVILPVVLGIVLAQENPLGDVNPESWWNNFLDSLTHNSFVKFLDSFFTSKIISFLFSIVFGMPYEASYKMVVVAGLWFYFSFLVYKLVFKNPKYEVKKSLAMLIGALIVTVINLLVKAIAKESALGLVYNSFNYYISLSEDTAVKFFIGILIIFVLAILYVLVIYLSNRMVRRRKYVKSRKQEKDVEELKRELKGRKPGRKAQEASETEGKGKRFLETLGEELSKDEGEGEFESPEFKEPEFET